MAKTEVIQIRYTENFNDLIDQLNFAFNRFSDRLDKLEGIRGDCVIQNTLKIDVDGDILCGFNTNSEVDP